MKLNLFLQLCLIGLIPVAVSILGNIPHRYELIMTQASWPAAQNYCRGINTDLATIISDTDWLQLNKVKQAKGLISGAWVGLYNDINSWRWLLNQHSLNNATFINWLHGEPNNLGGIESCGVMLSDTGKWMDRPCTEMRPFVCYNAGFSGKFIGVSSPQLTWSDARTYCRIYHTYMASSLNTSDNNLIWQITSNQGISWFGLYRDTWKWADGSSAKDIPWGSAQPDNDFGNDNCAMVCNELFYDEPCFKQVPFICQKFPTVKIQQMMRLQLESNESTFDPDVQSSILEQIKQKLEDKGMLENTTVTWKVQPDGNIFQKKKKDEL